MRSSLNPAFIIAFLMCFFSGCSSASNPASVNLNEIPLSISDSEIGQSQTGIFGAYSAALNTSTLEFEMTPIRNTAIGESYIVDAMSFFMIFPCSTCLLVNAIKGDSSGITIQFYVEHPLEAGNPASPPSGLNRLDLDVFDLAVVIWPYVVTAPFYTLLNEYVMTDFCINQSGYTMELSKIITSGTYAMPYFLVVDDSLTGISTFNKFAMGFESPVDVSFKSTIGFLYFNIYLTMGYGASATFWQRLTPKYYNPEFNRKHAWKITATPQGNWFDNSYVPVDVRVEVYDWQQGATVYPTPDDFSNAPVDQIYSQSDCQGVWIEVPGMADYLFYTTTPDGGTGQPGDPLVYTVPITNANLLPAGSYIAVARVFDTRLPDHSGDPQRDCIITSPDGKNLYKFDIPDEYKAYQSFTVDVWVH